MRTWQRDLIFIFFVIISFHTINQIVTYGTKKSPSVQADKIGKVLDSKFDTQIAIFGSSVALVHFDSKLIERATGKRVYNFGINATPLVEYKGVLLEFLNYSTCDAIVIAGAVNEFEPHYKIFHAYRYKPYLDNQNIYRNLSNIDEDVVWKLKYVPFYSFTTYAAGTYSSAIRNIISPALDTLNGFTPKYIRGFKPAKMLRTKFVIDPMIIKDYEEVISKAVLNGKKVYLVLTPRYIENLNTINNLEQIREVYEKLSYQNGVTFIDFTKSKICYRRDLFYDSNHLNANGAEIFSKEVSRMFTASQL